MDLVGLHSAIVYLLCRGLGPVGMRRLSSSSSAHAPPAAATPLALAAFRPPLLHRTAASKRTDAPTPAAAATAWCTVVVAPVGAVVAAADLPSATASCSTMAMARHDSTVAARAHRRRLMGLARRGVRGARSRRARHGVTGSLGLAGGRTGPRDWFGACAWRRERGRHCSGTGRRQVCAQVRW
jgi:hypothetical protein